LPLSGRFVETRIFSDKDDIYAYEEGREAQVPYPQRTTELTIINTADALDVKAYVVFNPIIYGVGLGAFNKFSFQIPFLIRKSLAQKQAIVVGKGDGIWGLVHIEDLVNLYLLILEKIVGSKTTDIPANRKGIYCSEAGETTFLDISKEIGKEEKALGVFETDEVRSLLLQEFARGSRGNRIPRGGGRVGFASK
jgi:nucleoside-diphosphate-sugar epimerase